MSVLKFTLSLSCEETLCYVRVGFTSLWSVGGAASNSPAVVASDSSCCCLPEIMLQGHKGHQMGRMHFIISVVLRIRDGF